ncbi:PP2C family protein-serine/threonine phosphatase [Speluncibacter jeojiensis]|uniref:SpoIIE family protein phosphatase n=1 Tax=Speluncibacter jeojiensis TaxID=2710754 RepID=A0A9X4RCN2_9ACTN|nr:SpoIIE family protein phosphatase [Corynebacteriales bacterium D3-21]
MGRPRPTAPGPDLTARLTLLLIEDDPGDALLVEEMAADAASDFDLVWAKSFGHAQVELATVRPDCILLDLHLPDAQGLDALDKVQRSARGVPVVVMTGLAEDGTGLAAVAAGAQDYLVKGRVDADLFTRAVRYAIERKRAEQDTAALRASEHRAQENARLERGLLPVPLLRRHGVEVVARYRPGRAHGLLGGDFYDVVEDDDGTVHLLIGDVCGHGPDEAALGVSLRIAWRTLVVAGVPAEAAMRTLEEILVAERTQSHIFATVTSVELAPDRTTMGVIRAGHPGFLIRTGTGVDWVEAPGGPALGLVRKHAKWTSQQCRIGEHGSLVLFTDGLFEGLISPTERLGEDGLLDYARTRGTASADGFVDALISHAERLAGEYGGLTDDVAVVHVQWTKGGFRS